MQYRCIYSAIALLLGAFPVKMFAQKPVIHAVNPKSLTVAQYEKFDIRLDLTAAFSNPYNYDEIRVQATFTAPDGDQTTVEGFYMEDFEISNTNTGTLSPLPVNNGFYVRFSPQQPGIWYYTVTCTNASGTGVFPVQTFQCTAAAPNNKGFVQATGGTNYLSFSNGEQYIPVGENIAWQATNPYVDYQKWVGKMANNGGNFCRLWLCHWGLGVEWQNNINGFSGLKKYKQSSAFYLDWLFDYCAEQGVYVQFCLNHHGQVSSQVNPNWSENPYNAANGGPCANTWDFFSNQQAKSLLKNRLRYILARWGCQRSIMTWELFNEVNWTDNYAQHKTEIAAWHQEMAAFLKQRDYTLRPVSTSYGNPQTEDPAVWNIPDLDYTQQHYYLDSPNLEAVLAAGARENIRLYDKPVHIGEFGLENISAGLANIDPKGIHIHNNMWGSFFGGGMGTGMSWWWDSYIEPQDLYHHFTGVAAVSKQIPLHLHNFRPATAEVSVSGAPGDLKINTALGWAGLGDTVLHINTNGDITPSNYKLGQFLYGAQWNTQYRRPPIFRVDLAQKGKFKIIAGSQFGTNPKLAIWIDGVLALSVAPVAGQTYIVDVPAGKHAVKVDNTGTDWMQIACYAFSGIGSAADAYILKAADRNRLAGWILNSNYNHVFVKASGAPNALTDVVLRVENMADGAYFAKWFDCQTGALLRSEPVAVVSGVLTLPVPELIWDVALVVDNQSVGIAETPQVLPVSVFPNPIAEGSINLTFSLQTAENVNIALCNANGTSIKNLFSGVLSAGEQRLSATVENTLPAGIYWLRVSAGQYQTTKAIGVVR